MDGRLSSVGRLARGSVGHNVPATLFRVAVVRCLRGSRAAHRNLLTPVPSRLKTLVRDIGPWLVLRVGSTASARVQPLATPGADACESLAASGGFCSRIMREETFYSRLVRLLVQVSLNSRYSNTGYSPLLLATLHGGWSGR